ncbi:hypothetical protein [Amaricoccus macauensis]|uniref:hypothetical protein n=1 Tax=Amaricoccus macauensis TaxID=57001 RepID=UPI003C7BE18B
MSDPEKEPMGPVSVTLELPAGLVRAYAALAEEGIYPSCESAMLRGLIESWRHNKSPCRTNRPSFLDQPGEADPADTASEAASADDASGS